MQTDIREAIRKHQKKSRIGRCLFVDENGSRCSNGAIGSHTIQRSGAIKYIVEDGHVLGLSLGDILGNQDPGLDFRRIGQSKASVFPGFCAKHDTMIFSEIENGAALSTKRQAVLLSYRVTCLEFFKKERNIALFTNPDVRQAAAARGALAEFDAFLLGTKQGFVDLKRSKAEHESALHNNSFERFYATVFKLDADLPFCFASPFAPEFTLDGQLILPSVELPWSTVSAFAGKLAAVSIFMVSGFESEHHRTLDFIRSLEVIPGNEIGGLALNLALEFAENTFFRESWIKALGAKSRAEMILQFRHGTPGSPSMTKQFLLKLPDRIHVGQGSMIRL